MCQRRLYVVRCHISFRLVLGTTRLSIVEAGLGPKCNGLPIDGTAYDRAAVAFQAAKPTTVLAVFGARALRRIGSV